MKKIVCFALCVSAAMMMASCVEEKDGQVSAAGELVEITLGVAGETSDVKSYMGGETLSDVLWTSSDDLAVYDAKGGEVRSFTYVEGEGTKNAVFSGSVMSGATHLWAVYPQEAASGLDADGYLSVTLPEIQTVGSYNVADGALVAVATAPKGNDLNFKNVFGLIKVTVSHPDVKKVVVNGTAVAGTVKVSVVDGNISSVVNGISSVTLLPPAGNDVFDEGDYFIAVLPGTTEAGDFSVEMVRSSLSRSAVATLPSAVKVPRNGGYKFTDTDAVFSWNIRIADKETLLAWNADKNWSANDKVFLEADIDMEGAAWTPRGFDGVFDGQGHKIYGFVISGTTASNVGFFNSLNKSAVMKNVVFGSSDGSTYDGTSAISMELTEAVTKTPCIGLVGYVGNSASMQNVTNFVPVTVTAASQVHTGGVAGYWTSTGTCSGCENRGAVTFVSAASAQNLCVGGLTGLATNGSFSGCKNYGKINASGTSTATLYLGGILGYASGSTGALTSCVNEKGADITGDIDNSGTSGAARIGGVIGYVGKDVPTHLTSCANNAAVSNTGSNVYKSDWGGVSIGGVAGHIDGPSNMKGCTNSGIVSDSSSAAYVKLGGIVGLYGPESAATACTIDDCDNTGTVTNTTSTKEKLYLGGILGRVPDTGKLGELKNCDNTGLVTCTSSVKSNSYVGGVVAYNGCGASVSSCTNTAEYIGYTGAADEWGQYAYVGGIAGHMVGNGQVKGCTNSSEIRSVSKMSLYKNESAKWVWQSLGLRMAGIVASAAPGSGNTLTIDGCTSTGNISETCTTAINQAFVQGGIFGYGESGSVNVTNSTADCVINTVNGSSNRRKQGMIVGYVNTNATVSATANKVAGTLQGTVLTTGNYTSCLWSVLDDTVNITSSDNGFLTAAAPLGIAGIGASSDTNAW